MTQEMKAQIVIGADASGAKKVMKEVADEAKVMGDKVKAEGEKAGGGFDPITKKGQDAAAKLDRSTQSMVRAIQRATAETQTFGKGASDRLEALANLRGLDPAALKPALDGLRASEKAAEDARKAMGGLGISAKQTAFALRGVPAQFTDIVTSLAGGQAPLTVLLQQGGQLKDMFGGVGEAARSLGSYILGLVNPYTVAAAAAVGLYLAFEKGRDIAREYSNALILSGNAAGTTVGQLMSMQAQLAAMGSGQFAAADGLATMARSGAVAADSLVKYTAAALAFEKATGQSVAQTAKAFRELEKAPLAAILKLNDGVNFLTADLYLQIKALEDQGRTIEAAKVAQDAYAASQKKMADEVNANAGALSKYFSDVKKLFLDELAFFAQIGTPTAPETELAAGQKKLAQMESYEAQRIKEGRTVSALLSQQIADQRILNGELERTVQLAGEEAAKRAESVKVTNTLIEYTQRGEKYKTPQERKEAALTLEKTQGELLVKAGKETPEGLKKRLAAVEEEFRDKSRGKKDPVPAAQLAFDIAAEKNALAERVTGFSNANKALDSLRSSSLINEQAYFDAKTALLRGQTDVQRATIQAEIDRFDKQKATGADAIKVAQQRAAAVSELNRLEMDAAQKQLDLDRARQDSLDRLKKAFLGAEQAQRDYLADFNVAKERELGGVGKGEKSRRETAGRAQVGDKYDRETRALENQRDISKKIYGELTSDQKAFYDGELARVKKYKELALDSYEEGLKRIGDMEKDWSKGASEAMTNYMSDAANVALSTEQLFVNSFKGMEDALVSMVMTGKANWKSLADSIVADILRIIIKQQIANALAAAMGAGGGGGGGGGGATGLVSLGLQVFGAVMGSSAPTGGGSPYALTSGAPTSNMGFKIPGRASGGPVQAGSLYEVNEKGPEVLSVGGRHYLMMGAQGGNVTPNGGAAPATQAALSGGNTYLTVNVAPPKNSTRETATQWGAAAGRQMQTALRRNG